MGSTDSGSPVALIIVIASISLVVLIGLCTLIYIFAIKPLRIKKNIKDLNKRFTYLDALLVGQDAQYVRRLEIISRSNLLYVDKHDEFSKRFKQVFEGYDNNVKSLLKELETLANKGQFKYIKKKISETKKALSAFEKEVNLLDNDLFLMIKPEEETRQSVLKLKENYRRLKQVYSNNIDDLKLVSESFEKVFEKLDSSFDKFEEYIECADYEAANALVPNVEKVIHALDKSLAELPKLCLMVSSVVPTKIEQLRKRFDDVEKQGLPLYNLTYITRYDNWCRTIELAKSQLVSLKINGVNDLLVEIIQETEDLQVMLEKEISDKEYFTANIDRVYGESIDLEKSFLKICSIMPTVREVYVIERTQEEDIARLKGVMERLGSSKRALDNYVHSNTKQPYSTLKGKLDELEESYNEAYKGISDFKAYLDSLKSTVEEAYSLVFIYFYRLKQIESLLREMNIDNVTRSYEDKIELSYSLVNSIDVLIKSKPIDVNCINEKIEELKNIANVLFDNVEDASHQMQLAENAIVYANRDRHYQAEVNEQLTSLEELFNNAEFDKVYRDANAIYHHNHVEESNNAR